MIITATGGLFGILSSRASAAEQTDVPRVFDSCGVSVASIGICAAGSSQAISSSASRPRKVSAARRRSAAAPASALPLGVFAEFERATIVGRVRAGISRARAEGKHLGRPYVGAEIEQTIRTALAAGKGIRKVALECGVGVSVVQRIRAAG